jgi:hypothetical protein
VLGAGGLALAALLIAVIVSRGRARVPAMREPPARAATASPPEQAAPTVARPAAIEIDEARPDSDARHAHQARTARRARFGPNKSPLIE